MTIGRKVVVEFHEDLAGVAVVDHLHFTDTFSYNGTYVSNVVVKKDDQAQTNNDKFVVTYFWADGAGPNLASISVAALLADAIVQVKSVMPNEVV